MNKPTARDLEALMDLFEKSDWKELDLRMEGFELYLSKDPTRRRAQGGHVAPMGVATAPVAAPVAAPASPAASSAPIPSHWLAVKAPNLGTFYRAPKPGAAPYVEIGQPIAAETEVCLIEVMKLFTSVRAGVTGTVRQIAVQDGQMVEHDQVLLYIEPA